MVNLATPSNAPSAYPRLSALESVSTATGGSGGASVSESVPSSLDRLLQQFQDFIKQRNVLVAHTDALIERQMSLINECIGPASITAKIKSSFEASLNKDQEKRTDDIGTTLEAVSTAGESARLHSKAKKLADALKQQQWQKELNNKLTIINSEGIIYSQDPTSKITIKYILEKIVIVSQMLNFMKLMMTFYNN